MDSYFEREPKIRVAIVKELEDECKVLTIDHLNLRHHKQYLGMITNSCEVHGNLKALNEKGYKPSSLRKHCVSGIYVEELDRQVEVCGIGFRRKGDKDVYYLDVIVDKGKNYLDYMREIEAHYGFQEWISTSGTFWACREKSNICGDVNERATSQVIQMPESSAQDSAQSGNSLRDYLYAFEM